MSNRRLAMKKRQMDILYRLVLNVECFFEDINMTAICKELSFLCFPSKKISGKWLTIFNLSSPFLKESLMKTTLNSNPFTTKLLLFKEKLLDSKSSFTKLDSQIREVAHQAEDIIESHMVDHMRTNWFNVVFCLNSTWLIKCIHLCSPRLTFSTSDLEQVARDLDSIIEEAEKLMKMVLRATESMSDTRSVIICIGRKVVEFPYGALSTSRLLRVLDFMNLHFFEFPTEIFEFINLRYLSVVSTAVH
ncbi:hypothetical protein SASPL_149984 [Salvia splendens]|uniref:Uncharacterized protein n=1 Tax=Salvia splendens TaxID=180675 RepID=A0A8X8Z1L5_SALSN|nr:hypothetical protein SASPL_149984 [Salvia splendens]